jgi:CTP:molybdopterin cytidylyltransferase MocA
MASACPARLRSNLRLVKTVGRATVLRSNGWAFARLRSTGLGSLFDVDTPEDLAELRSLEREHLSPAGGR